MSLAHDTVIVGGGQAGLALSYHLSQLRREHVVLERGRVAERWRSERWDSLAFQVPLTLPFPPRRERGGSVEGLARER
jgi:putative flavoprotein involved in K+ transport